MLDSQRQYKSSSGVLGHDFLRAVPRQKVAVCAAVVYVLAGLTLAGGLAQSPPEQPQLVQASDPLPPRLDQFGDPLPPGAVNRIGTTLFRNGSYASRLIYTPDSKGLISSDGSGVTHWDAATGKSRWRFALDKYIQYLAMSTDGTKLAVLSYTEFAVVATNTGKTLARQAWPVKKGGDTILRVATSADLGTFALGAQNGTVWLFDAVTGKEKTTIAVGGSLHPQHQPHGAMWFSDDAKVLLVKVVGKPGLLFFDTSTGKSLGALAIDEGKVFTRAFSGDFRLMATIPFGFENPGQPLDVALWDLPAGKQRITFKHNFDYTLCCTSRRTAS